MCYRQFMITADRDITLREYKKFLTFLETQVTSCVLARYAIALEKSISRKKGKYHIQCVFDMPDLKEPPRDFARSAKEHIGFMEYLMKSRKSACFQKLEEGQSFLLLAAGYCCKDPSRLAYDTYGISDEEFVANNEKYRKLVEAKKKNSKIVFPGRLFDKAVRYANTHGLNNFTDTLVGMFEDGYDLSGCVNKIDPKLIDLFEMKLGHKDPKDNLLDCLLKENNLS